MLKALAELFEAVVIDYFSIHPSLWAILAGLALQGGGFLFDPGTVRLVVQLAGCGSFLAGCFMYADEKGLNEAFGWLGLFHIAGLLVLFCMKDKRAL